MAKLIITGVVLIILVSLLLEFIKFCLVAAYAYKHPEEIEKIKSKKTKD